MVDFEEFRKVHRLFRRIVVTEKIDGTNAAINIDGDNISAQSRNRLLTLESDNFGLAKWVDTNAETLIADLGDGRHFGEWWGSGIQRKYGQQDKFFSLFNTERWENFAFTTPALRCVPVLYEGMWSDEEIKAAMTDLKSHGSYAAPGFMNPEGVVIFHKQGNVMFKFTFEGDDASKWELENDARRVEAARMGAELRKRLRENRPNLPNGL